MATDRRAARALANVRADASRMRQLERMLNAARFSLEQSIRNAADEGLTHKAIADASQYSEPKVWQIVTQYTRKAKNNE